MPLCNFFLGMSANVLLLGDRPTRRVHNPLFRVFNHSLLPGVQRDIARFAPGPKIPESL